MGLHERIDWRAYHQQLRDGIEMGGLLQKLGVQLPQSRQRGGYKVLCPVHREKTPSMHVYEQKNRAWCFGACGRGYDVIELAAAVLNLQYIEAADWLGGQFGISPRPLGAEFVITPRQLPAQNIGITDKARAPEPMDAGLAMLYHRQMTDAEYEWFEQERLLPRWVVDSLRLGHTLAGENPGAFTIPVWGEEIERDLLTVRYRIDDRSGHQEDGRKYWGKKGRNGVYPFGLFSLTCGGDWVVITESELDALVLFAWGIPAFTLTTGAIGQAKRLAMWERHIARFSRWIVAMDDDKAGKEASQIIATRWPTRAVPFRWPEGKWNGDGAGDVTDFVKRYGHAEFVDNIERTLRRGIGTGQLQSTSRMMWRGWGKQVEAMRWVEV